MGRCWPPKTVALDLSHPDAHDSEPEYFDWRISGTLVEDTMPRIAPFARVYTTSFAYCARLFTVGVFRREDRTDMKGICDMSGARVRPVPQVLPEIGIDDLLPNSQQIRIERAEDQGRAGQSLFQLFIIDSLCSLFRPMRLFEFGTYLGRTALNLAANSPDGATVFTLDGRRRNIDSFDGIPSAAKIVYLFGDSITFDYRPYVNSIDFILIDASHEYDAVLNDSRRAMEMLRDGHGVILWDDYDAWFEGTTRAVELLYRTDPAFREMKKIRGTSLVYLRRG